MSDDKPQKEQKHPPSYERDLNPGHMAGQNVGVGGPDAPERAAYASERKEIVRTLSEFNQDELAQIPLVREESRLHQGATYLDIRNAGAEPFTATGGMSAPAGQWIVPKAETPYELWNRLLTRR